jgi:hypothetical protein
MAFREYLTTEVGENWVDGLKTYPGVDHAFFNDTGGRYNPTQAGPGPTCWPGSSATSGADRAVDPQNPLAAWAEQQRQPALDRAHRPRGTEALRRRAGRIVGER